MGKVLVILLAGLLLSVAFAAPDGVRAGAMDHCEAAPCDACTLAMHEACPCAGIGLAALPGWGGLVRPARAEGARVPAGHAVRPGLSPVTEPPPPRV